MGKQSCLKFASSAFSTQYILYSVYTRYREMYVTEKSGERKKMAYLEEAKSDSNASYHSEIILNFICDT